MELHLFDASVYSSRRAKLKKSFTGNGLLLLPGNNECGMNYTDNQYPFWQDSSFLYFFGLDIAGLTGLVDLDSGDDFIAGEELTVDDMVWTGPMPSLSELGNRVDCSKIISPGELQEKIAAAIASKRVIHLLPQYRGENQVKLAALLGCTIPALSGYYSEEFIDQVINLRQVKEEAELAEMEKAVNISNDMHLRALQFTRPGMKEYEVGAQIEAIAKSRNGRFAYPLIFTVNGETLHNHGQHNTILDGKLVLCDAGAENEMHYAGDLTRTFPASEKFTTRQKEIYEIVLGSMDHAISLLKPGTTYLDVHRAAAENITDGLKALGIMKGDTAAAVEAGAHALFFPHGLGHMIGLDVHDLEALGEDKVGYSTAIQRKKLFGWKSLRLAKELAEGFVLTVEPGIYFIPGLIDQWSAKKLHAEFINYESLDVYRDFGGIRIEDNYCITATGSRKLGAYLPKTVAEIEALRAGG